MAEPISGATMPTSYAVPAAGAYPGVPAAPVFTTAGVPGATPVLAAAPPGTTLSASGLPISAEASEAAKEAPAKAHWTGSSGFVIAIIALVLVILVIILRFVWPQEGTVVTSSGWTVNTSNNTSNTIVGGNNVVYYNTNGSASTVTLTVTTPSGPTGQTFIVDNQANATTSINLVLPSGVSMIGGATTTVGPSTSAQFLWVSPTVIHRYWTNS